MLESLVPPTGWRTVGAQGTSVEGQGVGGQEGKGGEEGRVGPSWSELLETRQLSVWAQALPSPLSPPARRHTLAPRARLPLGSHPHPPAPGLGLPLGGEGTSL